MVGSMVLWETTHEPHVEEVPPDSPGLVVQIGGDQPVIMVVALVGPILVVAGVTWLVIALAGRKRSRR